MQVNALCFYMTLKGLSTTTVDQVTSQNALLVESFEKLDLEVSYAHQGSNNLVKYTAAKNIIAIL